MTVTELREALEELERKGQGEYKVIDNGDGSEVSNALSGAIYGRVVYLEVSERPDEKYFNPLCRVCLKDEHQGECAA
jgi:hypothetical protein